MPRGEPIFGKKFAERRDAVYLTQSQVATAAGISVETIKRIEGRDMASVMRKRIPGLASALKMTPDEFAEKLLVPKVHSVPPAPSPSSPSSRPPPPPGAVEQAGARKMSVQEIVQAMRQVAELPAEELNRIIHALKGTDVVPVAAMLERLRREIAALGEDEDDAAGGVAGRIKPAPVHPNERIQRTQELIAPKGNKSRQNKKSEQDKGKPRTG